jgi:MFS family permease
LTKLISSLLSLFPTLQIASPEFIWLTAFFLVNSFWANFYIGTFDMQLGDKHSLTSEERHAFAQTFTLVITLGVLAIPPVGALMDRKGFPATSLLCIVSGVIWALLLLADSPERHLLTLSFVFYSIYRTSFFTFFFAYLADVLGFSYFGMLGGVIFLLAGVLGMLQYPLALYAAGDCHVYTSDQSTCDKGRWALVNTVMVTMVAASLYFTYQDYVRRAAALEKVKSAMTGANSGNSNGRTSAGMVEMGKPASYGAV